MSDEKKPPLCKHCDVPMKLGTAMQQTYVGGMPDFPGDKHSVTFSAGGAGKLVRVWKCPKCGHSFE